MCNIFLLLWVTLIVTISHRDTMTQIKMEITPDQEQESGSRSSLIRNIHTNTRIPTIFNKSKIIAVCKHGKPSNAADSYRLIAFLSVCYKLLERLILNRISPIIDAITPIEQAGFRTGRRCTDQIAALTTYIVNCF